VNVHGIQPELAARAEVSELDVPRDPGRPQQRDRVRPMVRFALDDQGVSDFLAENNRTVVLQDVVALDVLEQVIKDLKDAAKEQEKLSEKSQYKEESPEKLAEEQEKLNEEFEKIQEDLKELKEINESLENQKDMDDTGKMEEDIRNDQQQSSEQLKNNQMKKAGSSQKSAAQNEKTTHTHCMGRYGRSGTRDSNPRPQPWQGCALPAELVPLAGLQ
jgi:DNA repair ATPase RecN